MPPSTNPKGLRFANSRKLLQGTKVEVRSLEEGFLGSWHSATVISVDVLTRTVRYDSLLSDDGSDNLIDSVKVSSIIDGGNEVDDTLSNCRGIIRPLPPSLDMNQWSLHYGQCVDMHDNEVWWEGVVFDHEDGLEERRIFFPDLGDERKVHTGSLRVTQDWDEVSERWQPRGNWLFLESIEEIEQRCPLLVSVKQIWYDVRVKQFGDLSDWTSSDRDKWKNIVSQVWCDNLKINIKQILYEFNSEVLVQEGQTLLELSEPTLDSIVTLEAFSGKSLSIIPFLSHNRLNSHQLASPSTLGLQEILPAPSTSQPRPADPVQLLEVSCKRNCKRVSTNLSRRIQKLNWIPLPTDKLPEPTLDFDAVVGYCENSPKSKRSLIPKVKGHILSLGWQFESAKDKHSDRMRFISPEGTPYHSLREVCRMLKSKSEFRFPKPEDEQGILPLNCDSEQQSFLLVTPTALRCPSLQAEYISSPKGSLTNTSKRTLTREWQPMAADKLPEPKLHYRAVASYCESPIKIKNRKSLLSKVRSHMLYLGWKFEFSKDEPADKLRFISPEGVIYYSLREVCRALNSESFVESKVSEDGLRIPSLTRETRSTTLPDECFSSLERKVKRSYPERKVKRSYPGYSKCNLQALTEYINNLKVKVPNTKARLVVKAREHLIADGWDLDYINKRSKSGKGKREIRYYSPDGKTFCSLVTACIWHKKNIRLVSDAVNPFEERDGVRKHSAKQGKVKDVGIRKRKKRKNAVTGIVSHRAKRRKIDIVRDHGQESATSIQLSEGARSSTRLLRSSKRIRLAASSSHHAPRNVLSLLIENNVIFPKEKVHCRGMDAKAVAEGTLTCYGIECCCCGCIFSISKFVVHAGSNHHQPAANIFFEDGRSMLDCQSQLMRKIKFRSLRTKPRKLKRNGNIQKNDYMCSVCHYGGDLILCDQCPASFHMDCLGVKTVPEGDWFCPSCCCGICGKSSFNRNTEHVTNTSGRSCSQCQRQYHVGCLRAEGLVQSNLVGEWFCNMQCEKIFQGLHQHLGRPIAVGKDNLTWTLVKYIDSEDGNHVDIYNESSIETFSKLTVALDVMHECFEPLKEPLTRRDIVEDIIFCKWSNLNRLNFHGFYTVLLEKDDELVTVATIRVHGNKVAEVPLIATRFQYRRHGMCRIVMDGIEKILVQLGVERIVLPAAPSVLDTWLNSFGFSKMDKSERLNFLGYTILDFQGTVMCQKFLKTTHSSNLNLVEAPIKQSFSNIDTNDVMDLDGSSGISEVYQADVVKDRELVDHGSTEATKLGNSSEILLAPAQPKKPEDILVHVVSDHKARKDDYNDGIIYYKRRNTSASRGVLAIKVGN